MLRFIRFTDSGHEFVPPSRLRVTSDVVVAVSYSWGATPLDALLPILQEFAQRTKVAESTTSPWAGRNCVFWVDQVCVPRPLVEVGAFGLIYLGAEFTLALNKFVRDQPIPKRGWCLSEHCLSKVYVRIVDPKAIYSFEYFFSSEKKMFELESGLSVRSYANPPENPLYGPTPQAKPQCLARPEANQLHR